jgi:hypothetical protein
VNGRYRFGRSTLQTMQKKARNVAEGDAPGVKVEVVTAIEETKLDASQMAKAQDEILEAMAPLDTEKRQRLLERLKDQFDHQINALIESRSDKSEMVDVLNREIAAIDELKAWKPDLVLEPNTCSRLHHVKQRLIEAKGWDDRHEVVQPEVRDLFLRAEHTFVVKHDWAGAFKGAEGIQETCRLPFDMCLFEFRLSGRTVIMLYEETTGARRAWMCIEVGPLWYFPPSACLDTEPMYQFLDAQVNAICIALDSEVAEETVIRAPAALNKKRKSANKVPLPDFHVVDLSRRHRIANPSHGAPTGRKVRLHFRRGHWRHYEDHRTWIKWMLVGNPELGYIQKHYAL